MATIHNPVLPGFSPDPSVIRVGDWFYLANSSFEWYPVVPIHRSRDLANWEFAGSFTGPEAVVELRGLQDSGGVWAPSLSWSDGEFWLVFTVVRGFGGPHKDMDTYVSKATDVAGPWSAPARVTTTGFDPSIFHHEGRHWLLNMEWDHRPDGRGGFAGINLQELASDGRNTIGSPAIIHRRPELVEGPNLYFLNGTFHLMLAEGGTGQNHGIAMMRSEHLFGPYEADPQGPLLTNRDNPGHPLQKAGHGELVEDDSGQLFLAHLASRWTEKDGKQYSILGRETCIQRLAWSEDGWLRLEHGGWHPAGTLEGPAVDTAAGKVQARGMMPDGGAAASGGFIESHSADGAPRTVAWPWRTLRHAASADWANLDARPGWLRLRGKYSTDSLQEQSLVARRLTAPAVKASVTVEARPENFTQSAGLIFYYNTASYFYVRTTVHEAQDGGSTEQILEVYERDPLTGLRTHGAVVVERGKALRLEGEFDGQELRFSWSQGGGEQRQIGPVFDATQLSDDHGGTLRFTGAMVGVAAQDLRDRTFTADFMDFRYEPQ